MHLHFSTVIRMNYNVCLYELFEVSWNILVYIYLFIYLFM
jgi:hypothetical protein